MHIEAASNEKRPALHQAARNGHTEIVSNERYIELHQATRNGHTRVVQILHPHGTEIDAVNSLVIVKKLLTHGARIEAQRDDGTAGSRQ